MNVTLAEWKKIEAAVKAMQHAAELADSVMADITLTHAHTEVERGRDLLMAISDQIHEIRQSTFLGLITQVHPQSEYLGGDPDDPKNHRLREPNCCPMPRRYFTQEELEEAKAECLGPCQWVFNQEKSNG